jgi:hypothetical protein
MSIKIILPSSHDRITLGQVMRYNKINADPVAVCKLFCKGDIEKATYNEVVVIAESIVELMNMGEPVFKPMVEIQGVEYWFHPDLSGMTTAEFVDMSAFCDNPSEDAHRFMAVIYRPLKRRVSNRYEIKSYQPDSIDYNPELFLDVPFSVYRGALAFFLTLAVGFVNNLSSYSPTQNQANKSMISKIKGQTTKST